jgi:hypothetical protein
MGLACGHPHPVKTTSPAARNLEHLLSRRWRSRPGKGHDAHKSHRAGRDRKGDTLPVKSRPLLRSPEHELGCLIVLPLEPGALELGQVDFSREDNPLQKMTGPGVAVLI